MAISTKSRVGVVWSAVGLAVALLIAIGVAVSSEPQPAMARSLLTEEIVVPGSPEWLKLREGMNLDSEQAVPSAMTERELELLAAAIELGCKTMYARIFNWGLGLQQEAASIGAAAGWAYVDPDGNILDFAKISQLWRAPEDVPDYTDCLEDAGVLPERPHGAVRLGPGQGGTGLGRQQHLAPMT